MGVNEHTKKTFSELQRKKMYRYVIFKVDEKKREVVVDKIGNPAESYEDFTAALPDNDCRYAVYDFDFVTSDNCQKSKIFFIAWLAKLHPSTTLILYFLLLYCSLVCPTTQHFGTYLGKHSLSLGFFMFMVNWLFI